MYNEVWLLCVHYMCGWGSVCKITFVVQGDILSECYKICMEMCACVWINII